MSCTFCSKRRGKENVYRNIDFLDVLIIHLGQWKKFKTLIKNKLSFLYTQNYNIQLRSQFIRMTIKNEWPEWLHKLVSCSLPSKTDSPCRLMIEEIKEESRVLEINKLSKQSFRDTACSVILKAFVHIIFDCIPSLCSTWLVINLTNVGASVV